MFQSPQLIAPSILASNFASLGNEVEKMERAGADWIHCDVMDGHFVDNISFGSAVVNAVRSVTALPIDVHLMIERPDHYLDRYLSMANSITCHLEARHRVEETLGRIRKSGLRAGLGIRPGTPLEEVMPLAGKFDLLLIMTVEPGFGGQPFLDGMLAKIEAASRWRSEEGLSFFIEVDGGINPDTAKKCREAGADVFVAGTALFQAENPADELLALRGNSGLE